jgi:hypothetical protein
MYCTECGEKTHEVKIPRGFDSDTGKSKFEIHKVCSVGGCNHSGHTWKDLPQQKITSFKNILKLFLLTVPPDAVCVVCGTKGYTPDIW